MALFDQEISFDMGHLILLLSLVAFIFFVSSKCKLSCNGSEGLEVGGCSAGVDVLPVNRKSCRCPDCAKVALTQAQTGQLYGCNPNNPYVPYSKEECNYQYRKALLHGCGIA